MQGVDVLTGLEESIAYANADSSDIEIDGETEAIRKIVPNTGIYFKKLKPKDKLPLSLETAPDYQFIKWNCDPADSVTFDDATSPATIANIISTQSPKIRIEPTFIRRPTVTFLPADITGGQPKNTAVEVIFSQPMELNETNVSNILIEVDGVSVLDSFNAPVISEDKTSVKFTANRNNLLDVGLGTKKVKVTVRDTFYHLEGENQIKLSSDAVYVYQINNTTNDKVKINYTCNTLQGRLSRVDRDEFYLDNEQTVTFEPAAEYQVTGWNVLFTDGSKVPQSILQTEISEDLKTIKVKVCDGSDKSVEITPVTALRPTVSFSPLNVFEMPKNTPIVITFSKPVELSKEMLDQIKIEIDSMSVRDNFQKPEVSADQKQITFKAERSKLIDISSGTKTVVITIPQNLAAIENGQKITLASDVIYAYKINNQTNDKIELNLTCAANEGVLNNAGLNTYYLDNEITTTFTENEAYQITGWTILDEEGNPVPETIIKRVISTDKRTIRLSVFDVMNGKISVSPVCCTRPVIYFVPDGTQTVEKNTNISINFSEPMELTAEDMTHITIVSDGEDLTQHFKEPALDETKTQVTFEAKLENLIPLESGIRTIVVTVPADFYYIDEASSDHITLGKDKSFTYRINSETSEKLNLSVSNKIKKAGSLNINGNIKLSVGQSQSIIFNVSSEYAFIEWQVFDGNRIVPKSEYQQFIDFDEQNSDTTLIVNRLTETLYTLVPYCVARPNIVSATPQYDTNGVFQDRRITIMFDKPLNKETIYYTAEEKAEIEKENEGKTVNFLTVGTDNNKKAYGYEVDGNIFWKCFTITKRSDHSVNLLDRYEPPAFDVDSADVLRIAAKKDNLPPLQTEILINVNAVFGITATCSDGKTIKVVSFANDYPWAYRTNSKHDSDVPEITELKLYIADENQAMKDVVDSAENENSENKIFQLNQSGDSFSYSSDKLRNNVFPSTGTDLSKLPTVVSKRYLVVQAKITDAGSGPKSIVGEITKVDSKNFETPFGIYPLKETETDTEPCLSYEANLEISGTDAVIKNKLGSGNEVINAEKIDLSSLGEGLYKINFVILDNNECDVDFERDLSTLEKNPIPTIYFIYDVTGPSSGMTLKEIRKAADKATLNLTNTSSDYAYTKIEYKVAGDVEDDDTDDDDGYNSFVESKHDGESLTVETNSDLVLPDDRDTPKPYKYRATAYDWAGNASAPVTFVDRTGPAKLTEFIETRNWADHSVVSWTNPEDADFANVFVECKVALPEETFKANYSASNKEASKEFTDLENLTRYVYYATAYDWNGNKSETVSYTDTTPPTAVSSLGLVQEKRPNGVSGTLTKYRNGKVFLTYITPDVSDFAGVKIGYEKYGEPKVIPAVEQHRPHSKNEAIASEAVAMYRRGKRYTFDVYACDFSGNVSKPVSVNTDCYINSAGNFVFGGTEFEYTSMVPILETKTTIPTFPTDMTGFDSTDKRSYDDVIKDSNAGPYSGAFSGSRGQNVTLDAYKLGKYEVTTGMYQTITGEVTVDDNTTSDNWRFPAMRIGYYQNVCFCNRLSEIYGYESCYALDPTKVKTENYMSTNKTYDAYSEDYWADINDYWVINNNLNIFPSLACNFAADGFRLPTELEWEFAARGGDPKQLDWYCMYPGNLSSPYQYYYYDTKNKKIVGTGQNTNTSVFKIDSNKNVTKTERGTTTVLGKLVLIDNNVNNCGRIVYGQNIEFRAYVNEYEGGITRQGLYGLCGNMSEWCWDRIEGSKSLVTPELSIYGLDGFATTKEELKNYNFYSENIDPSKVSYCKETDIGSLWQKNRVVRTDGYYKNGAYSNYYTFTRYSFQAGRSNGGDLWSSNVGMRLCQTIKEE